MSQNQTSELPETPTEEKDLDGVWSSPGAYTIEWQDKDYVKVTKHWRGFDDVAILTGGDFETILETIFTGAVVTRVQSPANVRPLASADENQSNQTEQNDT